MTRVMPVPWIRTESAVRATTDVDGVATLRLAPSLNGTGTCIDVATVIREAVATRPVTAPEAKSAGTARTLRHVAAGAAHDLANLLCVMGVDVDRLAGEPLSTEGASAVRSLQAEISYLRALTRDLRLAAAETEVRPASPETRLAAWWPDIGVVLLAMHGDDIALRADIPSDLPDVFIQPYALTQVVVNLVGNAAHAIADAARGDNGHAHPAAGRRRGEVEISARLAEHGRAVDLTVSDNGGGMSAAVLARACEPYFTTRAVHGGTGLGLAMVQRLVGDVGGCVRLSSVVGAGTKVTIQLPALADHRAALGGPQRAESQGAEVAREEC